MTAPVLDSLASPSLPSVLEGDINPAGMTVADLVVDGSITDFDGTAVEAIAIQALNTSLGTWQYSVNGGATWLTIFSDLINSSTNQLSLLLGPTAQIRMLPFGELNGSLSDAITFRAWDMSGGSQGVYVDVTSIIGGNSAFSLATDTAGLAVTAVNDAPTFNIGTAAFPINFGVNFSDSAYSGAVQSDGKIVTAGFNGVSFDYNFALSRYNVDGSLDTNFGTRGKVITDIGINSYDVGFSVTVQPDGKIVVAGKSVSSAYATGDFALVRYNSDGSLDSSFGIAGKVITDISNDTAYCVIAQPDGKIVVTGYSRANNSNSFNFALVRYNGDGSLDSSFGVGGKLITSLGSIPSEIGQGVTLQADGKLVVVGGSNIGSSYDFTVVRYNANGSVDSSFGAGGKIVTDVGSYSEDNSYSVTVQLDGKLVVAGVSNGSFALMRFNSDGSLDGSFGTSGKLITDLGLLDSGRSVSMQLDGKIVVAGSIGSNFALVRSNFALVRYNADGSLDASFSDDGKVITAVGSGARSVTVQPDGKIVVVGGNALVRYNSDGSLDASFGGNSTGLLDSVVTATEPNMPVVIATVVRVIDPELFTQGNYDGAILNLHRQGGANVSDVFGVGGGWSFTQGGYLSYAGTVTGTVTQSNGTLTLNFNSNASQAVVDAALQSLTYTNTNSTVPVTVTLAWSFSDGNLGDQGAGGEGVVNGTSIVNVTDLTPPTVSSFRPTSHATGVAVGSDIVVTFREDIQRGTGNIVLKNSLGTVVATYDAASSTNLSITGNTLTINPSSNLVNSTSYSVEFASGSIKDVIGNLYGGTTSYSFMTEPDTLPPTVTITDNLPGTANRTTGSVAYSLVFSESVTGLASNDFTVTNGTVSSVSGSGSAWTVNVIPALGVTSGMIGLTLKAGAVSDATGNLNAVMANTSQALDTSAPVALKLITNAAFNFTIDPRVTLQTSLGTVVLELNPEQAPITVANMLAYVDSSFYDSTLFHRVINGFMVQGGGFNTGLAYKAPTYSAIALESDNGLSNLRGTIAMARTSVADSATTQFFVNQVDNTFLNYSSAASPGYAVFGKVVSGLAVIDSIAQVPNATVGQYGNVPVTDVTITSMQQTVAGSSSTNAGTLTVSGLEAGAQWSYSLDSGATWVAGAGNSLAVPDGSYAASAIQVRQTDAAGNVSASAGKLTSAVVVDATAPTVSNFIPADEATGIAPGSNLVLTFSETIVHGIGSIVLKSLAGGIIESFDAATSARLAISGSTLTLNPTADLNQGAGYTVQFTAGTVKDLAGNGYAGTTSYNFSTLVNPNSLPSDLGKTVNLLAYSWKAHTLLDGVSISGGGRTGGTTAAGATSYAEVTDTSLSLTASRAIPTAEASATNSAVNLQDAIAILKMIVGLDVNGAGKALSPYQTLAADYDGNGTVGLTDAIGVLKHVVGLTAPAPTWHFVNEIDTTIPGKTGNLNPGTPQATINADLNGAGSVHIGLVGYLRGDVDGSYAGATGALDLDNTQASYFTALVGNHPELSLSQFGVYAA